MKKTTQTISLETISYGISEAERKGFVTPGAVAITILGALADAGLCVRSRYYTPGGKADR